MRTTYSSIAAIALLSSLASAQSAEPCDSSVDFRNCGGPFGEDGLGSGTPASFDWASEEDRPDKLCAEGDWNCHKGIDEPELDGDFDWMKDDERPEKLCSAGEWGCHDWDKQDAEGEKKDGDVINIWNDLFDSASSLSNFTAFIVGSAVVAVQILA